MRRAKDCNGDRLFTINDFLTAQQIASFFSRQAKSAVQAVTDEDIIEEDDMDECSARQEEALDGIRLLVRKDIDLYHPIVYDTYNICDLVSSDKLSRSLSVSVLREICVHFDLDVDSIKVKRKKPYADKLHELVQSCSCRGNEGN
jgi:Arf-GAP/Rho-GAP domain/ANK repeat/PH domain-containing protein 3